MALAFEMAQVCVQVTGTPHKGSSTEQNKDSHLNNAKFKTVNSSDIHTRVHTHSLTPAF